MTVGFIGAGCWCHSSGSETVRELQVDLVITVQGVLEVAIIGGSVHFVVDSVISTLGSEVCLVPLFSSQ